MRAPFNSITIDQSPNSKVIKLSNYCKGKVHWACSSGYLAHVNKRLNLGNHSLSVNLKNVPEGRKVNLKMPSTLVVYITHANSNPRFPSSANKAILLWVPLLEPLHNFLHIIIVFPLAALLRFHGRPDIAQIDIEVD
uniref:Uncharacterized protein n=1 Tax=Oryza brachyantha TaxID=4533 RepID=J3N2F1_ORYBR